jgi:XRE family transcriptional regulator, regulator of sulfur utilization
MITKRDLATAVIAASITLACVSMANEPGKLLDSTAWRWADLEPHKTEVGERREVVQQPTRTLDELEMHITTLNAGQQSHAPHQHAAEELIIIKEGTLESFVNGEYRKVGPGSIVFQASNQLHAIRNIGKGPATYHVIQWQSPGMLKK